MAKDADTELLDRMALCVNSGHRKSDLVSVTRDIATLPLYLEGFVITLHTFVAI
jgi:hypothetical protein